MRPFALAVLLVLLLPACAEEVVRVGAACPCARGWTCCASNQTCVRAGEICPLAEWETDDPVEEEAIHYGADTGACAVDLDLAGVARATLRIERTPPSGAAPGQVEVVGESATLGTLFYEPHGLPKSIVWGDAEIEYTYADDGGTPGRLERKRRVSPGGTRLWEWSYLQDGTRVDVGPEEGPVQERERRYLDARGRTIRREIDQRDSNQQFDGLAEEVVTTTYDEHGPLTRASEGFQVAPARFTFLYDGRGRNLGYDLDLNGDGVVDDTLRKAWDDAGRLLRREYVGPALTLRADYRYDCE